MIKKYDNISKVESMSILFIWVNVDGDCDY